MFQSSTNKIPANAVLINKYRKLAIDKTSVAARLKSCPEIEMKGIYLPKTPLTFYNRKFTVYKVTDNALHTTRFLAVC